MLLVQFIFGLLIKTFGLALIIRSHLGTGAWEAFYIGLSKNTGLSIGFWIIIIGFFLIWFNAWLWRRKPTYSSFVTIAIVGLFIDWWLGLLEITPYSLLSQMTMFWIGLFIAAMGASLYLLSNVSPTPIDQLMLALSHRFQVSLMSAKTIGELFALVFALALHGSIGFGTVIFTLLFGPLIQFFMTGWKKVSNNRAG
ncbi:YitT family protein [Shimazuella sp. AN120528]|uniref:YczE/YyaS/YitT family protein n=1 Tax=Shimazuella soli TaxID=1892854 RepID=UPI001F0FD1C7|nr:YitT family protein [Shimazuella soli]MCH5585599.1 YitT family protein [Shimazuella soli]